MTDLLVKSKELLRTWSKDEIKDFLIDITTAWEKLDYDAGKTEIEYDLYRIERFEHYKRLKNEWRMNWSDTICDKEAKKDALKKYGDQLLWKKIVKHYEENIDQLKQRIIDINTINKEQREAWL